MDLSKVNLTEKMKSSPLIKERIKGMNFGFLSKRGYYATDEAKRQPAIMRGFGVNCVTLNLNVCQEKYSSTKVFLDFEYSVGEDELVEMAKLFRAEGISVILKPCMTCLDGQPMCSVDFPAVGTQIEGVREDYRAKWFNSYEQCVLFAAALAEKMRAEALMIGAELLGVEGGWGSEVDDCWTRIIEKSREVYSGLLTYEFTFASRRRHELKWFKDLDFLSYSYYPPACPADHLFDPENNPTYTLDEIREFLSLREQKINEICARFDNKPILFTEYGVRSAHGCIQRPYNFEWRTRYDGEEQANFMKASFEVFDKVPYWMGLLWWKWDETQNRPHYHDEAGKDKGFTIQGKPAEKIFREA